MRRERLADRLEAGDLAGARALMPNLVGRDPQTLDATGMARAAIESVAENTSDAVVGPLVWGALAGAPGVVAYRIVNTLDAMVGHHSERYERFGFAAARLDDLAGLLPARLTAALAVVLAPLVGGSTADAWRAWRRDAAAHPSPNAGPCEAAFAGALGVRLGGPTVYPYGLSERPWQGDGRDPRRRRCRARGAAFARRDARRRRGLRRCWPSGSIGCARDGRHERRAAGRRDHVGRGQERGDGRALPLARPPGRARRAVQGAEHVAELDGHGRRRRDRTGAGDAGRGGPACRPRRR